MNLEDLLIPFGKVFGRSVDIRNALYDRGVLRSYDLGVRTISVGNLTTGGTGKTPIVAFVAEILAGEGERVCILTRGYGRKNAGRRVLVSDGQKILSDPEAGGDEPIELARRLGEKAIIIADADRVSAAAWARERFGVTAFILDDGFQHRRARRDVDIVCIDATDPCGNGRMLPAGRLRESFRNLDRADAIVITRADLVSSTAEIEARLRARNADAPLFRAVTQIKRFTELVTFLDREPQTDRDLTGVKVWEDLVRSRVSNDSGSLRVGAFCGIGNPDAFFEQLRRSFIGIRDSVVEIAMTRRFNDHHRYGQNDIDSIERASNENGVDVLVTTAKDAVKLDGLKFRIPCFVVESESVIDRPEDLRVLLFGV